MLVQAESVKRENDRLELQVTQAAAFVEAWNLTEQERLEGSPLSLRFAVGKQGPHTILVIGVRREGRGFDIGIPKSFWDELAGAVEQIRLTFEAGNEESKVQPVNLPFPEDDFEEFLSNTHAQAKEFPERTAIVEVAEYFFPEDES